MPLEHPDNTHWQVALGYLELGMALDADAELEKIDPFNRAAPQVLALRIEIYRKLKKWELMREIAKRLNDFQPDEVQWVLSYAFATRRAVSVEVAREILLKSVARFPNEAAIFFNISCYEAQEQGEAKSPQHNKAKSYKIAAIAAGPASIASLSLVKRSCAACYPNSQDGARGPQCEGEIVRISCFFGKTRSFVSPIQSIIDSLSEI
jgi:hypothetical protein